MPNKQTIWLLFCNMSRWVRCFIKSTGNFLKKKQSYLKESSQKHQANNGNSFLKVWMCYSACFYEIIWISFHLDCWFWLKIKYENWRPQAFPNTWITIKPDLSYYSCKLRKQVRAARVQYLSPSSAPDVSVYPSFLSNICLRYWAVLVTWDILLALTKVAECVSGVSLKGILKEWHDCCYKLSR